MGHIFISYSSKDVMYVEKLINALRREGFNPWVDVDNLQAGNSWHQHLQKQINTCDAFILIMSRNARNSQWVPEELVTAKSKGKPIFPLVLDNSELFLGIQTIQVEDVRGNKLPAESFYEQLAAVTPRRKSSQKVDSIHLTDRVRQKNVDSITGNVTSFLARVGYAILDFFSIFFRVIGNILRAVRDNKTIKRTWSNLQRSVRRSLKR